MFNGHAHDVAFPVNINIDILTDLFSLNDLFIREFNMSGIRIRTYLLSCLFPLV